MFRQAALDVKAVNPVRASCRSGARRGDACVEINAAWRLLVSAPGAGPRRVPRRGRALHAPARLRDGVGHDGHRPRHRPQRVHHRGQHARGLRRAPSTTPPVMRARSGDAALPNARACRSSGTRRPTPAQGLADLWEQQAQLRLPHRHRDGAAPARGPSLPARRRPRPAAARRRRRAEAAGGRPAAVRRARAGRRDAPAGARSRCSPSGRR